MVKRVTEYGYIPPQEQESQWIHMTKGQNIAGYSVGILYIEDVFYPLMPGNVVNAYTYDFPVRMLPVEGLDIPKLMDGDESNYDKIIKAANKLEKEGCRAISAACGFFGRYQKRLAADIDVPVAFSSMTQIPWVKTLLKPHEKIGVLTANAASLDDEIFEALGILPIKDDIIIANLRHEAQFSAIMEDRGAFDNAIVRKEVVGAARRIVDENPDIGAIVLECSDMPPYAAAVQAEVGLPVWDFITLIKWLNSATAQRPYSGII
jgi:Asp/Glu/hydantoin racemase